MGNGLNHSKRVLIISPARGDYDTMVWMSAFLHDCVLTARNRRDRSRGEVKAGRGEFKEERDAGFIIECLSVSIPS